jgi:chemotaxis protein methyltransferase CheR
MDQTAMDYQVFKGRIHKKTGLDLSSYKQNQMERRLRSFMERAGAQTFHEYYRMLELDHALLEEFMDRVTINVSELFRNPEQFQVLESRVIPDILRRSRGLSVWSAGCSYGPEPYTLSICLNEALLKTGHKIIATDIDDRVLQRAREGAFDAADCKNLSPARLTRWFRRENDKMIADDSLKAIIDFRKLDLLKDRFPNGQDLILCRNVVIYFTEQAKDELYARFFSALKPGGYLFVGGTERISKYMEIGYTSPYPFFYQKPLR